MAQPAGRIRSILKRPYLIGLLIALLLVLITIGMAAAADRGAWAPNVSYAVNDTVTYNGSTYKCLQAHTSLTGWEPATTPALWQLTTGSPPPTTPPPTTPPPTTPPPGGLPSPWQTSDVGSVSPAGSASHSSGTFTVRGSGADIWGNADAFRYVYQTVNGNYQITARVATLQNTNAWAKAGVMVRENTAAGSKHASMFVTPTSGLAFQRRTATGGVSENTGTGGAAPYWVRVIRNGSTLTGQVSTNGSTWSTVGTASISMTSSVTVGLAVTSHVNGTLAQATFDNVSVVAVTSPPPTTPPPSGFSSIMTEAQFNQMFPNRNSFYTYQGLVNAQSFWTAFGGEGTTTLRKQEVAAAMANFAHETGGLWYITEIAQGDYCEAGHPTYPCAAGQKYYGRGPIQLSWNYNYGTAGAALGLPLLTNPNLVQTDASVAWKTALWYWMTQNGPGTMTPHNCIVNGQGFGCTIRSINGALECNGGHPDQVQSRINYFNSFLGILGVPAPPGSLTC